MRLSWQSLIRSIVLCACLGWLSLAKAQDPDVPIPDDLPVLETTEPVFFDQAAAVGTAAGLSWAEAEYLHWWISGNDLPPLATTSPAGTARADAGVIGAAGTTVLFGGNEVGDDGRSGFRVNVGRWLDDFSETGVELTWFSVFNDGSGDFRATSPGSPTIARPFFDPVLGANNSEITAFVDPGGTTIAEGEIEVGSGSEMHSLALSVRRLYQASGSGRVDLLAGYRFLKFRDGLLIRERVIARDPGGLIQVGTTFDLTDRIECQNNFHGGEVGFEASFDRGFLTLEVLGKVAVGNLRRDVTISGSTLVREPAPSMNVVQHSGGLLSQPTNIGRQSSDEFVILPEVGVNLMAQLNQRVTVGIGYTVVALTGVARSGDQIDTTLNPTQFTGGTLAGAARPMPLGADSDLWVHGANVMLLIEN